MGRNTKTGGNLGKFYRLREILQDFGKIAVYGYSRDGVKSDVVSFESARVDCW